MSIRSFRLAFSHRALPIAVQARIVIVVAVAAAIILSVTGQILSRAAAYEADIANGATGTAQALRLTPAELATFEINTVAMRDFRTEEATEGRIALNGDTTTPVFSPYS